MRNSGMRLITTGALVLSLFLPGLALAGLGDCSQPTSSGDGPVASDCLFILKAAVGAETCDPECVCDVTGNGAVQASDALDCLRNAVGQDVALNCPCPNGSDVPCTSAQITALIGSDLDSGWTGIAHNADLIEGAEITVRVARRCSDSDELCVEDEDCTETETCDPTCDCINDTDCEVAGPTHQKRCITTLTACDTADDCPAGVDCRPMFGPPLPLSSAGNPVCIISVFDNDITGTSNSATGDSIISVKLKSRIFLGITIDQPCPRCGRLDQNPEIGDTFTCEGGQFPGATCTTDSVSPDFGGTSFACPPELNGNISGSGLAIIFNEVTTGTTTKQAQLPCGSFLFQNHPDLGPTTCIDDFSSCSTNADCSRCTGDATISCSTDDDCIGNGTCGVAPEQPITCGVWCHCGFCDDDPDSPCFDDSDCTGGATCQVGSASVSANAPQQQANDCGSQAAFICGLEDKELCHDSFQGTCSGQSFRACSNDSTCAANNAGVCVTEFKPCFESEISRTGVASPLGSYCQSDPDNESQCTTNADCADGDPCVSDSSRPSTAALFCVPATSSSTINSAGGITGPGAINLKSFIKVCRCGDGEVGCDETCDDSNSVGGDGCDENCQIEP